MERPTRYPLFIVGSPRSGTSILIDALRGAGYQGFSEGNFLSCLQPIERLIDQHFETFDPGNPKVLISRIDRSVLKTALYQLVCQAAEAQYGDQPWVDKTGNPEMIAAIPIILQIWPCSHFIFAKRRAIENVFSRLRKFPRLNFAYHCGDWARNMAAWRRIRSAMPNLHGIEVDQREISVGPANTAARIAAFLGLGDAAAQQMTRIFETNRPQQTENGSAERLLTLRSTGWSEQQVQVFHTNCDEEMRAFGYTEDETYWLEQNPAPATVQVR
jgi:predicted ATPase